MIWAIYPGNILDLSDASSGQNMLDVDVGDFLDHNLSRSTMFGSDNAYVGTSAEFFDKPVLGIDDECRVEGGVRALELEGKQGRGVKAATEEATVLANTIKTFHNQT